MSEKYDPVDSDDIINIHELLEKGGLEVYLRYLAWQRAETTIITIEFEDQETTSNN